MMLTRSDFKEASAKLILSSEEPISIRIETLYNEEIKW